MRIDGAFERGDAVVVRGPDGAEIGRGLCAYDADDAQKIRAAHRPTSHRFSAISGRAEMIHRDDLIVGRERLDTLAVERAPHCR